MRQMKVLTFLCFGLAALGLAGCSGSDHVISGNTTIHGSGVVIESSIPIKDVTGADLAASGKLHIVRGASEGLRIRAEDNLISFFAAKVTGGILRISRDSDVDLQPTGSIEFFLTVTELDNIMLSGIGEIELIGMATPQLSVDISGLGSVALIDLDADRLDVTLSGFGAITASGDVDEQNVTLSGFGDYGAADLASRIANVRIESSGSATVRVSDHLTAVVAGAGSVFYIGNPVVSSTITGSGTVEQI